MSADAKPALAQAAVALLAHARVVILDGSTTNLELARRLPAGQEVTVLTNSPPIAAALAEHPSAEVVMIGGRLDKHAQVTVGAAAVDFLRTVRADACVLGVCALHPEAGLSTDDLEEAHVKRAMVAASADVIALATADKLRAGSAYLVAPVAELTHVVVEAAADDELLDPYRAARRHGDARMSRRWATTGMFFVNGAVIGTWVAQIPWTQERFDLSKSTLGIVLVAMSIAVIVASPIAGQLIVKHGSRRMTLVGGVADALAVNLVVLAPHPLVLAPCLLILGACNATMDMSMNAHGVEVEQELGRPIMSSLHAGWSFGGVAGAGLAAGLVALGVHPRVTVAIASAAPARRSSSTSTPASARARPPRARTTPRLQRCPRAASLLLAILCLLTMVTEGAMGDWGGIYLRGDLGASAAIAAVTFSVFSAGMTTGRIVGDWVTGRLGPVRTLQAGALLTGVSLGAALLIGMPDRRADRALRGRPRRRQRRAADVQRRRPPARHRRRARRSRRSPRWARSAS